MSLQYIIVQAGGKGTRLKHLTSNKPKALVPIHGKPMLFHLFDKFPSAHFIIIGDYKIEVLKKYLQTFAKIKFDIVDGSKHTKTCAGLQDALNIIPENIPFMYIWSDLVLPENFSVPDLKHNYIGISKDFICRWQFKNNEILEESSREHGIAGLFIFSSKEYIKSVPYDGAFVRWLSQNNIKFKELPLHGTQEYGLLDEYNKIKTSHCRPFNSVEINNNLIIKKGITDLGRSLAEKEISWYKYAIKNNISCIPQIILYSPLSMEKIDGCHPFEIKDSNERKIKILKNIFKSLAEIHNSEAVPSDNYSFYEAYISKTYDRLETVKTLIPFADREDIIINNKLCKNPLFAKSILEKYINNYKGKEFKFIHGDCTFSNTLVKEDNSIIFIDPRGYFGKTRFFGDPAYDYAKLYYSLSGNYDQFNRKKFILKINDDNIEYHLDTNDWDSHEKYFWEFIPNEYSKEQIQLIHGIIWLSLTTYAWDDYDSICCAFYIGTYLLSEVIHE